MNLNGITTNGDKFVVFTIPDQNEIIYSDCFGDSLTWNDTPENRTLVKNMITEITTKDSKCI